MESTQSQEESSAPLRDVVVTLPTGALALLFAGVIAVIAGAGATLLYAQSDGLRNAAATAIVLMLPVLIALIAAAGVRRTSTRQIDRLVDGFLHHTVPERFRLWCDSGAAAKPPYPFDRCDSLTTPEGRSYAHFRFHWRDGGQHALPPADVAVKMNVFNFEVIAEAELCVPAQALAGGELGSQVLSRKTLDAAAKHPLLRSFFGTLQGSIEEGYAVRLGFGRPQPLAGNGTQLLRMAVSLRQKLGTNFLTSPFLKRYFAEDAAIVIGVLYGELRASGLLASAGAVAALGPRPEAGWAASPR